MNISDERESEIYHEVQQFCRQLPITSLDEVKVKEFLSEREAVLRGKSWTEHELRLALSLHKQMTSSEIQTLKSKTQEPIIGHFEIVRRPNELLGGRINFIRIISEGATSIVAQAKSGRIEEALAIKYLTPDKIARNYIRVALALDEMQNLFKVRHRNVVHVYDAGYTRSPEGEEVPYILMEYLEGCTLDEWRKGRTQEWLKKNSISRAAAEITAVVAETMHFLHTKLKKPILHLDLKPSNIMVVGGQQAAADEATIKIIDFGSFGTTKNDVMLGTRPYMAPERFLKPVPPPTTSWDVFSLGAILYELVTGKAPEAAETSPPSFDYIKIPDQRLAIICQKATATNEADRYHTASQLAEDLQRWLNSYPLLHADGKETPLQRQGFLLKRSLTANNLADHTEIVAQMGCLLIPIILCMPIIHYYLVSHGWPQADAFLTAGNICNGTSLLLLMITACVVRFHFMALKILEPIVGLVSGMVLVLLVQTPKVIFTLPSWPEIIRGSETIVLLLAILNITLAANITQWKYLRIIGWGQFFAACFARRLFEIPTIGNDMPLILALIEISGCAVFIYYAFSNANMFRANEPASATSSGK